MNAFVREHFDIMKQTLALRGFLLDALTDADLDFSPGGNALTLRELCKQIGETQQAYIDSYTTLRHDYGYTTDDASVVTDVAAIKAWYGELDRALLAAIESKTDADLNQNMVDRVTFKIPLAVQAHLFREALFIFYGAANVYVATMNKQVGGYWHQWIG